MEYPKSIRQRSQLPKRRRRGRFPQARTRLGWRQSFVAWRSCRRERRIRNGLKRARAQDVDVDSRSSSSGVESSSVRVGSGDVENSTAGVVGPRAAAGETLSGTDEMETKQKQRSQFRRVVLIELDLDLPSHVSTRRGHGASGTGVERREVVGIVVVSFDDWEEKRGSEGISAVWRRSVVAENLLSISPLLGQLRVKIGSSDRLPEKRSSRGRVESRAS